MRISQIVISSKMKHAPNVLAFTEQGVAMLSGILNSDRAIEVNITIMRVFVRLQLFWCSQNPEGKGKLKSCFNTSVPSHGVFVLGK